MEWRCSRTPRDGCGNGWPGSKHTLSVVPGCHHCPDMWAIRQMCVQALDCSESGRKGQRSSSAQKRTASFHSHPPPGKEEDPGLFSHSLTQGNKVSCYIAVVSAPGTPVYPSGSLGSLCQVLQLKGKDLRETHPTSRGPPHNRGILEVHFGGLGRGGALEGPWVV